MAISKDLKEIDWLFDFLNSKFETNIIGPVSHYLGLQMTRDSNGNFMINQEQYIKQIIEETGLSFAQDSSLTLNPEYMKSGKDEELLTDNKKYQKLLDRYYM